MGRNAIPKLGEWRDGQLYEFTVRAHWPDKADPPYPRPDDGRMICYERTNAPYLVQAGAPVSEILATCYADGFQECMASMYHDGFTKGKAEGRKEALAEVRRALGIKEG